MILTFIAALALQVSGAQSHTGKHLRKHHGRPAPTDIYCGHKDQMGIYGVNENLQHDQRYDACGEFKGDEAIPAWSYPTAGLPDWSCVRDLDGKDHRAKYRMCSRWDVVDRDIIHDHIVMFQKWDGNRWMTLYTNDPRGCPDDFSGQWCMSEFPR